PHREQVARDRDVVYAHDRRTILHRDQRGGRGTRGAIGRLVMAGDRADHALARETDQHRTEFAEAREGTQQREIVFERLAESEAGVDEDAALVDARELASEHALG